MKPSQIKLGMFVTPDDSDDLAQVYQVMGRVGDSVECRFKRLSDNGELKEYPAGPFKIAELAKATPEQMRNAGIVKFPPSQYGSWLAGYDWVSVIYAQTREVKKSDIRKLESGMILNCAYTHQNKLIPQLVVGFDDGDPVVVDLEEWGTRKCPVDKLNTTRFTIVSRLESSLAKDLRESKDKS